MIAKIVPKETSSWKGDAVAEDPAGGAPNGDFEAAPAVEENGEAGLEAPALVAAAEDDVLNGEAAFWAGAPDELKGLLAALSVEADLAKGEALGKASETNGLAAGDSSRDSSATGGLPGFRSVASSSWALTTSVLLRGVLLARSLPLEAKRQLRARCLKPMQRVRAARTGQCSVLADKLAACDIPVRRRGLRAKSDLRAALAASTACPSCNKAAGSCAGDALICPARARARAPRPSRASTPASPARTARRRSTDG
eukprot:scaffold3020_cov342-Prasinococcus_capsulatus_cf.AAC.12